MKNSLISALGICAAFIIAFLGIFIPKAFWGMEEARYVSMKWTRAGSGSMPIKPDPTPSPAPGMAHELNVVWLYMASDIMEDINRLVPREPAAIELSMEDIAKKALGELDLMTLHGAIPELNTSDLHFKSAELRGYIDDRYTGMFEGEASVRIGEGELTGFPFGLWFIAFEDAVDGRTVNVICDSQYGLIYSVEFETTTENSAADCFAALVGYAEYFGLPLKNILLDNYGNDAVMNADGLHFAYSQTTELDTTSIYIGKIIMYLFTHSPTAG